MANIQLTVTNDAGETTSKTDLATTDEVLSALEQWRQANIAAYPEPSDMWQMVLGGFVAQASTPFLKSVQDAQAIADQKKREAVDAQQAVEDLKANVCAVTMTAGAINISAVRP